jgi:hypothetical protein
MEQLTVASHCLTGHGDRPKEFTGGVGTPVEMEGKVLIEDGTVDAEAV